MVNGGALPDRLNLLVLLRYAGEGREFAHRRRLRAFAVALGLALRVDMVGESS